MLQLYIYYYIIQEFLSTIWLWMGLYRQSTTPHTSTGKIHLPLLKVPGVQNRRVNKIYSKSYCWTCITLKQVEQVNMGMRGGAGWWYWALVVFWNILVSPVQVRTSNDSPWLLQTELKRRIRPSHFCCGRYWRVREAIVKISVTSGWYMIRCMVGVNISKWVFSKNHMLYYNQAEVHVCIMQMFWNIESLPRVFEQFCNDPND